MSVEEQAHTDSLPTPNTGPGAIATLVLAGVVFVTSVVALVVLIALDKPVIALVALVTPVVTALLVSGHVSIVTREQNVALGKIERQTNGVLDARMREAVHAALSEAAPLPVVPIEDTPVTGFTQPEGPSTATMPAEWVPLADRDKT